jgi:hypothetical protein
VKQVGEYVRRGFRTVEDWLALHGAGIIDIEPWAHAGLERRARPLAGTSVQVSVAQSLAAFAAAGGTPARLGVLSRAGISMADAARFAGSVDPWVDGAELRAAVLAEEVRVHDAWGQLAAVPTPWPWTALDYVQGVRT